MTMSETGTMHDTNKLRNPFLEALSERARHLTPIRGRFMLDLKCCLDDTGRSTAERLAKKLVAAGNLLAILGLWEGALYQWQRAVLLDPVNSDARNNLAIAYELDGRPEQAKSEYERALAIERNNIYIRQNYELYRRAPISPQHELATRTNLCH
jgi:tetratricopeptide (TPR) repeat protein